MRKLYPFFIIGTVGMIITSTLHIFLALGLSISSAHLSFYVIYPIFIAFLAIGFGLILKNQKKLETKKLCTEKAGNSERYENLTPKMKKERLTKNRTEKYDCLIARPKTKTVANS